MNKPTEQQSSTHLALYHDAIDRMLERIDATASIVGEAFPLSADPQTGMWLTAPDGRWTGGFWVGLLWLAYKATGIRRYADLAGKAMKRLEVRLPIDNVLNGLVFYYGASLGAMLEGGETSAVLGRKGATALARNFNPTIGFIPLGHQSGSLTGDAGGETNIDGVPGMCLLFWAAANGGDSSLAKIGASHVRRHVELCQRSDGSLHQAALVDPTSGKTLRQYSPRGISHDSSWARAQSWGLVGFAQAYVWTQDEYFLEAARRVADWWIENAPPDRVTFWDFKDPRIPETERDTSATAMTAAALLKVGALVAADSKRRFYLEHGAATVRALIERFVTPTHAGDQRQRGMLVEGCWQRNEGMGTRHELIWGDYYLFEALLMLAGKIDRVL